jgi:uncharacterized membrane protein
MERIRNIVVLLRGQLWIIPLMLSVLALALAYWVLAFGPSVLADWDNAEFWWLYGGDASSARGLLSSLLSGLMTMSSLVVSVTFVILTLAANQLGPRLIPTFMGDRQIQTVLGLFLGTILYVLVVLRSLDETLGPEGVPHVAVTVGSALTVVCLFALLFYLHKVARAIVADSIVAQVADDLHRLLAALADIDAAHDRSLETIRNTPVDEDRRNGMISALQRAHSEQRAPYVQELLALRGQMDAALR